MPVQVGRSRLLQVPAGLSYITGMSADRTHFVDQRGNPRLFVGEDLWALVVNGGKHTTYTNAWNNYFTSRQAQGYNAVEVLWCSNAMNNNDFTFEDGRDWDGTYPFSPNQDPSGTPNSTFWGRRDEFFTMAASYGFTVVMNITTKSIEANLPQQFQRSWTNQQWTDFGTFIGNRYKNQPNIMWIMGDDYFGSFDSQFDIFQIALRAAGDGHLISIQNYQETTSRQDIFTLTKPANSWDKRAQYEWCYSYNVTYDVIERAHLYTPIAADDVQSICPPIWGDGFYLASGVGAGQTDQRLERQMVWWALSSGAAGVSTGDNEIYPWASTSAGLVTSKSIYSGVMPAIIGAFSSLVGWQSLVPDTSSVLVTAGRGTHASAIESGGAGTGYTANTDDYVTASRTPDTGSGSSLAVIYCGKAFNIAIDQSKMTAGYTVTWIRSEEHTSEL